MGDCILKISIVSNPSSYLAASAEVFSHLPFRLFHEILPVSRLAIWSWNPLRSRPMRGVTTQVSAPKSNTYWTTDLNKNTDTRGLTPSLLSILNIF